MSHFYTTQQLRKEFLTFFEERGHKLMPSSSLVPTNDKTLLFTNAGMVQFKDWFLANEKPKYARATTSQRCLRAGGKHNDLDQVGYTARHHTFFEMLGNFSFGDYFKQEAIHYAWEFLTNIVKLPPEKLWVTIYKDDEESEKIWLHDIGIDKNRFTKIATKDNFWSMGDTGPCGPCTEIFYDHGPEIAGGPPGSAEEDGDRYVEIWNLVFMQYDQQADGKMVNLPNPCVDTGMGLERIAAALQGVHNNYEIDLFQHLIKAIGEIAQVDDMQNKSLRVIADHIRACVFLIADGVVPARDGRGYVLRRIIRRAVRHGRKLEIQEIFFYKLLAPLQQVMGEQYPEIIAKQEQIISLLKKEEQQFIETLDNGLNLLKKAIPSVKNNQLDGKLVFKLYDTYGFPYDLTADIAREHHLTIDKADFDVAMEQQKQRAKAASNFAADNIKVNIDLAAIPATQFNGYETLQQKNAKVLAIIIDGKYQKTLQKQQKAIIILDSTTFYAESGGQVGDKGIITTDKDEFKVTDTQKLNETVVAHIGYMVSGSLAINQSVTTFVEGNIRQATVINHSATHLLHAALKQVLGKHVEQKGSLVDSEHLRFDFSHYQAMTMEEIVQVESIVNQQIRGNNAASVDYMSFDQALSTGAEALFGEKYGDEVRVVGFGDFSTELCGGTHVNRVGDIGIFKIIEESSIAAGIRRVIAMTGQKALDWINKEELIVKQITQQLKTKPEKTKERVQELLDKNRHLERELQQLKNQLAANKSTELIQKARLIGNANVLAHKLSGVDGKTLRNMVDDIRNKLDNAIIVLANVESSKISLVSAVNNSLTNKVKAGELINHVASQVGGKGGGRPDLAQAGGNMPEKLPKALTSVYQWVEEKMV